MVGIKHESMRKEQTSHKNEHNTLMCFPLEPMFTRDKGRLPNFIDEPTSAIDPLYEKELNDLIFRRIGNDSTLIIISHRLSIAKMADRVLVLDHGTIAEQGKHEELLANSDSLYQKLWNAQLSWYGE